MVQTVLFIVLAISFLPCARSHSFLLEPTPDWGKKALAHCRLGGPDPEKPDTCRGPCIAPNSWALNRSAPTTTWKRGQYVQPKWAMNRHRTGFVRLTLVPRAKRMSFAAHEKGAFHYTCWDANKKRCDKHMWCGTSNYSYETTAVVPNVPDGDYVLGWSWFGGFAKKHGKQYNFADYWSCANIRIRGSTEAAASGRAYRMRTSKPIFISWASTHACRATTNRLGVCRVEPCAMSKVPGKPRYMRPYGFPPVRPKHEKRLPHKFGFKIFAKRQCRCSMSRPKHVRAYIESIKLFALDKRGRLTGNGLCLCDALLVDWNDYKYGFTILAYAKGLHMGARFRVNGKVLQDERRVPYAIRGDNAGVFTPYRPNRRKVLTISVEAQDISGEFVGKQELQLMFT